MVNWPRRPFPVGRPGAPQISSPDRPNILHPPRAGDGDRWVWVRFGVAGLAGTRLRADAAPPVPARVLKVSAGRIALHVDAGVPSGDLLHVELPATDAEPGGTVLALVTRADLLAAGGWAVACEFAADLSEAEVAALAGREPPGTPDRRTRPRRPARGTARYYPLGCGDPSRWAAVMDVSVVGAGLLAAERVEPGAVLCVDLTGPHGRSIEVMACVVAASPASSDRWLLGCSFAHELSEADVRSVFADAT